MKPTLSNSPKQGRKQKPDWPKEVQPGRAIVRLYKRKTPSGNWAFMVANYADGERRRFDCYHDEAEAIRAATKLAERIDSRDFVAASITRDQAIEYANSAMRLKPFGISVDAATATILEALKLVGDLGKVIEGLRFFSARHRPTTAKPVSEVVRELLNIKKSRGASARYCADLEGRLNRFASGCNKSCCNVSTADVQEWLDAQKTEDNKPLSPQSYRNFRTVLHTLFQFAVARGYSVENPVKGVEKLKVRNGDVEVFTPTEIARLLEAAQAEYPEFVPCLAIGAFAGLRSAEIERLTWQDIDLTAGHIIVAASKSKTASRRIVPISENLAEWLRPYANRQGNVWMGTHYELYDAQQDVASATAIEEDESKGIKSQKAVTWKANGLRHSYASYRFAQTSDAGRVAGECGNSAAVVHRHYRELVTPIDAQRWFAVKPQGPANILNLPAVGSN